MGKKTKQPRQQPPVERIALHWLLATGACACAALVFEIPVWITLVFAASVAWR